MADTTIKVDKATRDRLAELARERGTTIRNLVDELAGATPTKEELQARFEYTKRYLEEHFLDAPMTEAELQAAEKVWQDLAAGRRVDSL